MSGQRTGKRKFGPYLAALLATGLCVPLSSAALSAGIELKLLEKVPVPTPRPDRISKTMPANTDSNPVSGIAPNAYAPEPSSAIETLLNNEIPAVTGSLEEGLDALAEKDANRAVAIRNGLAETSLDRKILSWAIATSGLKDISSGEISRIAASLPDWPGQNTMQSNLEAALAREEPASEEIVRTFGGKNPVSLAGAIQLAAAHISLGRTSDANAIIAPWWREENLGAADEKKILEQAGEALTREDHRFRMHKMLYRDRAKAALRVNRFAEQASLAKARVAVIRQRGAKQALAKVAPSSKEDPGFLFARIANARKTKNYELAAELLKKAPKTVEELVEPHEWWVEQRIVSRGLLDEGKPEKAYEVAANHSAKSRADRAEAEFHAGWYALRFLNDPAKARGHFQKILKVSQTPISQARAYYWLGRASGGTEAQKYFRAAAKHAGTFYGQLAAQKVGIRKLEISRPIPTAKEREAFKSREFVQVIGRLEETGHGKRAGNFYYALSDAINNPGEMALLTAQAEKGGNPSLALRLGKRAHYRGMDVDTLAWPTGAIPASAQIGVTGKALAYAIARQESEFRKDAVSPANARGLLQLLPGTAKDMARKLGVKYSHAKLTSDAGYNATLGAEYLSTQLDRFDNSYILTIAGYNAGPRRSREWVERYGDPRGKPVDFVIDWIERIPFTETRNYVMRVMENYTVYKTRIGDAPLDLENDLRFGRR